MSVSCCVCEGSGDNLDLSDQGVFDVWAGNLFDGIETGGDNDVI